MNRVRLKYLRRLLKDEEERLALLNGRRSTYEALRITTAYTLGRVQAYKELIEFFAKG